MQDVLKNLVDDPIRSIGKSWEILAVPCKWQLHKLDSLVRCKGDEQIDKSDRCDQWLKQQEYFSMDYELWSLMVPADVPDGVQNARILVVLTVVASTQSRIS